MVPVVAFEHNVEEPVSDPLIPALESQPAEKQVEAGNIYVHQGGGRVARVPAHGAALGGGAVGGPVALVCGRDGYGEAPELGHAGALRVPQVGWQPLPVGVALTPAELGRRQQVRVSGRELLLELGPGRLQDAALGRRRLHALLCPGGLALGHGQGLELPGRYEAQPGRAASGPSFSRVDRGRAVGRHLPLGALAQALGQSLDVVARRPPSHGARDELEGAPRVGRLGAAHGVFQRRHLELAGLGERLEVDAAVLQRCARGLGLDLAGSRAP